MSNQPATPVQVIIEQASAEDMPEILALQRLAYQEEAAIYNDYSIPPLTQTPEELAADFASQVFLKASHEGKLIGSVRAHLQQQNCLIGRLIVHPDFQQRGIGSRLLAAIEQHFHSARRYELFTGHRSERNIALYQRRGYTLFKRQPVTPDLTFVFMEKGTPHAAIDGPEHL